MMNLRRSKLKLANNMQFRIIFLWVEYPFRYSAEHRPSSKLIWSSNHSDKSSRAHHSTTRHDVLINTCMSTWPNIDVIQIMSWGSYDVNKLSYTSIFSVYLTWKIPHTPKVFCGSYDILRLVSLNLNKLL